ACGASAGRCGRLRPQGTGDHLGTHGGPLFRPGARRWSARAAGGAPLILGAPAGMLVASLMLGGLLPLDARTREHWAPSGAFRMPVGDPYQVYETDARPHAPAPFFILRGVAWEGERASHQGVDLASGSAGALVRAAAAGVVIQVADHGPARGYGTHVVLPHRLPHR